MIPSNEIDMETIMKGFRIHQNKFTGYWFCLSNESNEDGEYQFCFKDLEYQAAELCRVFNHLSHELSKLKRSRDKWRQLTKEFVHYNECYEKAIEQCVNEGYDQVTINRINQLYAEYEKEMEDDAE